MVMSLASETKKSKHTQRQLLQTERSSTAFYCYSRISGTIYISTRSNANNEIRVFFFRTQMTIKNGQEKIQKKCQNFSVRFSFTTHYMIPKLLGLCIFLD